jgi:hypothetical protein
MMAPSMAIRVQRWANHSNAMAAPSLFHTDITLGEAQVMKLESMLVRCSTYSLSFGIFKEKDGKHLYIGTIWYSVDGKPQSKIISKPSFGEMVTTLFETIQSLKL